MVRAQTFDVCMLKVLDAATEQLRRSGDSGLRQAISRMKLIGLARKPNEGPATTLLGKLSCAIHFAVRRVGADTKTKGVHMTPFAAVVLPDVMMWMVLALTGIMVIGLIDAVVFRWRGHQQ